jgi:hypothetical protein
MWRFLSFGYLEVTVLASRCVFMVSGFKEMPGSGSQL